MRPQSILNFERFYLGSLALGVLNYFLSYDAVIADLAADPVLEEMGLASFGFALIMTAFAWAIALVFWYFIARRASNIAKWILVVMTGLGLLYIPTSLTAMGFVTAAITLVITALQLVALYFLFRADAKRWLESKGNVSDDITTFE